MKQTLKYQFLSLFQKLKCEVRVIVDHRSMWTTTNGDAQTVSLLLNPYIGISIDRPAEVDGNGSRIRPEWNINDHISMTKLNFPIMMRELKSIQNDLQTPDMYKYTNSRLELNEKAAAGSRRVFSVGRTTIELSIVVINQADRTTGEETLLEGIKMKFNNESSVVYLTINELDSLVYTLDHLDVDSIALAMYTKYSSPNNGSSRYGGYSNQREINVDILPADNII